MTKPIQYYKLEALLNNTIEIYLPRYHLMVHCRPHKRRNAPSVAMSIS